MKKISFIIILFISSHFLSCQKYLDVVPDNTPTIDYAFSIRSSAERFLHTCYSWMPSHSNVESNPAIMGGGEYWLPPVGSVGEVLSWGLIKGLQTPTQPLLNYWDAGPEFGVNLNQGRPLFQGIRDCNIFLENIHLVPNLEQWDRIRWTAEVNFLKAYYHYWLLRMYGPIPIIDKNLPISASPEEAKVTRQPVDEVFNYIVALLDTAMVDLPPTIDDVSMELGRITKPIAAAIKAEVLVTAASPFFNGNTDYANFRNKDGQLFFNTEFSAEKWVRAAEACKEAVDLAHELGYALYEFAPVSGRDQASPTTAIQMSIRNSVTERWNSEVIWGNNNSLLNQAAYTPRSWDPARTDGVVIGRYAPPLTIVEQFYSENGVPIDEDRNFDYNGRFDLRIGTAAERYNIKEGYTTAALNFNRENRFYASLGFDGGIWYGQGRYNDQANDLFYIMGKSGQVANIHNIDFYSTTGYWPKKLINYQNVIQQGSYSSRWYPWPVMRLANLYLLYAEALNEVNGPTQEAHDYVDLVRRRAGLQTVASSWQNHSVNPSKPSTKDGFREIVHRERMIELAFEGQRYWDLRRWKKAHIELSKPISGWDIFQREAAAYYQEVVQFYPRFRQRDYLWPISEHALIRNDNLVQNMGW